MEITSRKVLDRALRDTFSLLGWKAKTFVAVCTMALSGGGYVYLKGSDAALKQAPEWALITAAPIVVIVLAKFLWFLNLAPSRLLEDQLEGLSKIIKFTPEDYEAWRRVEHTSIDNIVELCLGETESIRTRRRARAFTQLIKEGVQAGEVFLDEKLQTKYSYDGTVPEFIYPTLHHHTVVDINGAVRYLKSRGMDVEFFKYRDDS